LLLVKEGETYGLLSAMKWIFELNKYTYVETYGLLQTYVETWKPKVYLNILKY